MVYPLTTLRSAVSTLFSVLHVCRRHSVFRRRLPLTGFRPGFDSVPDLPLNNTCWRLRSCFQGFID